MLETQVLHLNKSLPLLASVKCTKTHIYYAMKNCNGDAEALKAYVVNIIDHYKVYTYGWNSICNFSMSTATDTQEKIAAVQKNQVFRCLLCVLLFQQGDHSECHEESRCQQEGYVCSKKPLASERAIAAYRKAIEGTTIYKNAADYAMVLYL